MSEAETSTSANCPESGKFVDSVLQLVLPSGGSEKMATETSETTSDIEKELLIETKSDLPAVDVFHLGKGTASTWNIDKRMTKCKKDGERR